MSERHSIHGGFAHKNPIPNASRIGNVMASSLITGIDPVTGKMPPTIEEQAANMFGHIRSIMEAAGGGTQNILKLTIWLQDVSQRAALNRLWEDMFPDEHSRPARQSMPCPLDGGKLVQCDLLAVLD